MFIAEAKERLTRFIKSNDRCVSGADFVTARDVGGWALMPRPSQILLSALTWRG